MLVCNYEIGRVPELNLLSAICYVVLKVSYLCAKLQMAFFLVSFVSDSKLAVVGEKETTFSPRGEQYLWVSWGGKRFEAELLFRSASRQECYERLETVEKTRNSRSVQRPGKRVIVKKNLSLDKSTTAFVSSCERSPSVGSSALSSADDIEEIGPISPMKRPRREVISSPPAQQSESQPGCSCNEMREELAQLRGQLEVFTKQNARMLDAMEDMRKEVRKLSKARFNSDADAAEGPAVVPIAAREPIIYNGENLLELPGSTPSRFGAALARRMFSEDELKTTQISPQKRKGRAPAAVDKVEVMKSSVKALFGEKKSLWNEAKRAANQVGLDLLSPRHGRPLDK